MSLFNINSLLSQSLTHIEYTLTAKIQKHLTKKQKDTRDIYTKNHNWKLQKVTSRSSKLLAFQCKILIFKFASSIYNTILFFTETN